MDLKQIEKLMIAMENSRIKRIVLKKEDFEIEIERECAAAPALHAAEPTSPPQPMTHSISALPRLTPDAQSLPETSEKPSGVYVTSPMVGTFYSSPSPDDPPFVKVGDIIDEGTVVGIIEAMKVMNEVKAGVKGMIAELLLKSGEPVEFGTRMFRVTPA